MRLVVFVAFSFDSYTSELSISCDEEAWLIILDRLRQGKGIVVEDEKIQSFENLYAFSRLRSGYGMFKDEIDQVARP